MSNRTRIPGFTRDYELFLSVDGNRSLRQEHVAGLVKSMREHGNLSVITCKEVEKGGRKYLEVIDGQHRLQALKICNLPVEYDIYPNITKKAMISLNENQKNWTLEDYLNFGISDGISDYVKLKKYKEQTGFSLVALLSIFNEESYYKTYQMPIENMGLAKLRNDSFRTLVWRMGDEERGIKIIQMLKDFYHRFNIKHYSNQRFIRAFAHISSSPEYEHDTMLKQLERGTNLMPQLSHADYLRNFEEVYNYNSSPIKRVIFSLKNGR